MDGTLPPKGRKGNREEQKRKLPEEAFRPKPPINNRIPAKVKTFNSLISFEKRLNFEINQNGGCQFRAHQISQLLQDQGGEGRPNRVQQGDRPNFEVGQQV